MSQWRFESNTSSRFGRHWNVKSTRLAGSMSPPIFRFAPSPNGFLHLGHAYSSLLNFDLARASGGRFLLRIEDIDATRCRVEFEQAIYEDLAWLGIAWETPVRRESEDFCACRPRGCSIRAARAAPTSRG